MMWTYYDRQGRSRVGDEDTVIANVGRRSKEEAYARYLDDFYDEVDIMDYYSYSPSELFQNWSEDDFAMHASEWFQEALYDHNETDIDYLGYADVVPLTGDDIKEMFDDRYGTMRELLKDVPKAEPRPKTRPPTPVERARQANAKKASSTSLRSKAKPKTKAKAKAKTTAKKMSSQSKKGTASKSKGARR